MTACFHKNFAKSKQSKTLCFKFKIKKNTYSNLFESIFFLELLFILFDSTDDDELDDEEDDEDDDELDEDDEDDEFEEVDDALENDDGGDET